MTEVTPNLPHFGSFCKYCFMGTLLHSMPSRHALSAAVLAAVWLYFYPAAGCVMVGIALLICCLRVLTGVHHVRDVVCGFALGFALGCAGMWLL